MSSRKDGSSVDLVLDKIKHPSLQIHCNWTLIYFQKPVSVAKMEDKYDRTVTGLAVCLGIAVIFGLIMAVIVGWDCMAKAAAKKKRQLEVIMTILEANIKIKFNVIEGVSLVAILYIHGTWPSPKNAFSQANRSEIFKHSNQNMYPIIVGVIAMTQK